jgi:hypothetical protein
MRHSRGARYIELAIAVVIGLVLYFKGQTDKPAGLS